MKNNIFTKFFDKNNIWYTILFLVTLLVIIINRIFAGFDSILWIADIGTLCGVLNIIFTAKHSVWGLVFNLISSAIIVATSIIQHVWLTAFVVLVINIPFLIYGIYDWLRSVRIHREERNLRKLSNPTLIWLMVITLVINAAFTTILYFMHGNVFYLDSLVSSFCMMGVIMSALRYIDQFYFFIIGNAAGIPMYTILTMQNVNNLSYILLFAVDLIIAIMGLHNWWKLKRINDNK